MARRLIVIVKSEVDGYTFERLEDKIRDVLEEEGIDAEIEDFATGNTTVTRKEEMGKKEKEDIEVNGRLILGEKIWFNDDLRCRLRVCGFSREQQDALRNARFVDLTITNYKDEDTPGVIVHISQFGNERPENSLEERCE